MFLNHITKHNSYPFCIKDLTKLTEKTPHKYEMTDLVKVVVIGVLEYYLT